MLKLAFPWVYNVVLILFKYSLRGQIRHVHFPWPKDHIELYPIGRDLSCGAADVPEHVGTVTLTQNPVHQNTRSHPNLHFRNEESTVCCEIKLHSTSVRAKARLPNCRPHRFKVRMFRLSGWVLNTGPLTSCSSTSACKLIYRRSDRHRRLCFARKNLEAFESQPLWYYH